MPSHLGQLLNRASIQDIAAQLGLEVRRRRDGLGVTLCPFHPDKTPSLTLYDDPGNPHYHCFACNATGGVLDLVSKIRREPRSESFKWLARQLGIPVDSANLANSNVLATIGGSVFGSWLESNSDDSLLSAFSEQRGFSPAFLEQCGV